MLPSLVFELSRHVRVNLQEGEWTPLCQPRHAWKLKDATGYGETRESAHVALCGAVRFCQTCLKHAGE